MKIRCLLGIHKKKFEQKVVYKGENTETSNCRDVCEYCDWKTEWQGITTFSHSFYIKKRDIN